MDSGGGWNQSLSTLEEVIAEVKVNSESLCRELDGVKAFHQSTSAKDTLQADDDGVNRDLVLVSKKDLWRLGREIRILRDVLPHVINGDIPLTFGLLENTENELSFCQQQLDLFSDDRDHWKTRCEVAVADLQKQQEATVQMEHRVDEVSHQLLQQSEYCANMGAACATLLWRVSRRQDSIESILSGSQVNEFLSMVASTIESYTRTSCTAAAASGGRGGREGGGGGGSNAADDPDGQEKETEFVLALCGITTNIAASSYGRDFLLRSEEGRNLVDTFATILQLLPVGKCTKLKTLLLMTIYNISINQSGWKQLRSKPGLITLLAFLVREETDGEMRLNCLRLIQSLLYDDCLPTPTLLHEAREVLTPDLLQMLSSDECEEIQIVAIELRRMFGRYAVNEQ